MISVFYFVTFLLPDSGFSTSPPERNVKVVRFEPLFDKSFKEVELNWMNYFYTIQFISQVLRNFVLEEPEDRRVKRCQNICNDDSDCAALYVNVSNL